MAKTNKPDRKTRAGILVRLAALLCGHRNIEMWCSPPERKVKLYYVWSSALGPMADSGEPTLEAAIDKFWTTYRRQHLKRSKPNNKVRDARAESGASPSVEASTE